MKKMIVSSIIALGSLNLVAAPHHGTEMNQLDQLARLLMFVILIIGVKLGWLAIITLYTVLKPQKVISGSHLLSSKWLSAFFIGIPALIAIGAFMALTSLFLKKSSVIINGPILVLVLYLIIIGATYIWHNIGERIQMNMNSKNIGSSFWAVIYGGTLMFFFDLIPIIGQLLALIVVIEALGISIISIVSRKKSLQP